MAQSVVYADLKFAASPPLAVPSCPAAPDEDDSPYENVLVGTVPAEPSPGQSPASDTRMLQSRVGSGRWQWDHGGCWAHSSSHLISGLAGRWTRRWRAPRGPLATSLMVLLVLLVVGTVALAEGGWGRCRDKG